MRRDNLRAIVGLTVLDMRNRWVGISEISYLTEASSRQISSILSQIPDIDLEVDKNSWGKMIKLNADDAEVRRIWRYLMHWRYHIDDVFSVIEGMLPDTGWVSIRDIAAEAHIMQRDVIACLEMMPDEIQTKGAKKQMMCRRIGDHDVSEHKGAADAGDGVAER